MLLLGIFSSFFGFIWAAIVGLFLGLLGRMVVPGKQSIPLWLTCIVGMLAAIAGTALIRLLGIDPDETWFRQLIAQVICAAIGVTVAANLWARRKG